MNEEISMTFAGCGFLALYYSGVVVCLKKYVPDLKFKHISGASAGAFAACAFLSDVQAEKFVCGMCEMIGTARRHTFGPFSPTYNITDALRKQLGKLYPDDAHVKVSGRLRVSMTRVSDRKNVVVDHFDTKEDLINCLLASSFVPVFSGIVPPEIGGEWYMDGMFSDNLPSGVEHTITVSPFCGETDICPRYEVMPFFHVNVSNTSFAVSFPNLLNLRNIFWPPTTEALKALSKQGYEDAVRYLHMNKYINCERCIPTQLNGPSQLNGSTKFDSEPQCLQSHRCDACLQQAIKEGLPEPVLSVFQRYIDSGY